MDTKTAGSYTIFVTHLMPVDTGQPSLWIRKLHLAYWKGRHAPKGRNPMPNDSYLVNCMILGCSWLRIICAKSCG